MADVEGGACAPPVFQGDPELAKVPSSFPWHDLLEGVGDFNVDKDANNCTRWKQLTSTTKGAVSVTTYSRSLEEKGGLSEFLIRGTLPIDRDTYFCVNADMEYRPQWDDTCVSLTELSSSGPDAEAGPLAERQRVLHWNVNYPWPLGKRDYLLEQTVLSGVHHDGKVFRCTRGRIIDPEVAKKLRPCEKGISRIEDYRADLAIWSGRSEDVCCFALCYFEDGKLSVPNWVLTKAAGTTIPSQLAAMIPVAAKYPKKRRELILKRFGAADVPGESVESIDAGNRTEDEAFFSASDCDSPKVVRPKRIVPQSPIPAAASKAMRSPVPTSASKVAIASVSKVAVESAGKKTKPISGQAKDGKMAKDGKVASKLQKALRLVLPKPGDSKVNDDSDDDADLEEGVTIKIGKEERDLLLGLLAEAREKQAASCESWWLCCKRRCGHKRRHKQ